MIGSVPGACQEHRRSPWPVGGSLTKAPSIPTPSRHLRLHRERRWPCIPGTGRTRRPTSTGGAKGPSGTMTGILPHSTITMVDWWIPWSGRDGRGGRRMGTPPLSARDEAAYIVPVRPGAACGAP